jgi:branched-chain amino acid transport system substrate-binding protein
MASCTFKVLLAALGVTLFAVAAAAQDTIKIGVSEPLTGAFAASGNYVTQGAKIAEDEINAAGGVLGRKIQLIVEDNKSNPTEAVATVEKLIVKDKVPVLMGAWSSTLTLAVMPKLIEYSVPMVVETSSSGKITTSGNPFIFRISPTSEMEAKAFQPLVAKLGIKKADFLNTNNDFGIGSATEFSKMLKASGVEVGVMETMDPKATDFSAQLTRIKASGGDALFVTTAVEQNTLILKQAKDQQVTARIITTGGSNSPDQLVAQAGDAANGSFHTVFFPPWFPEATKYPEVSKRYMEEWKKRGHNVGGLTEGFRGYDGIYTIVEGIKVAGKADAAALKDAFWKVHVKGIHGDIVFTKQGPAGQESGQNVPSVYLVKIEGGKVIKPNL